MEGRVYEKYLRAKFPDMNHLDRADLNTMFCKAAIKGDIILRAADLCVNKKKTLTGAIITELYLNLHFRQPVNWGWDYFRVNGVNSMTLGQIIDCIFETISKLDVGRSNGAL